MSRLLELATKGAFWLHLDSESSEHDASFETCRHSDCVLVRASAPSVARMRIETYDVRPTMTAAEVMVNPPKFPELVAPSVAPCPDPFNETHEHQWVTETRCCRCGVVEEAAVSPLVPAPEHEDVVCKHGVAVDVHCCGCHSGFLFDPDSCTCLHPPTLGLYRCTICGTRWLLWPKMLDKHSGGWNLLDKYSTPGACCDNAEMGAQIEHLRDFELYAAPLVPAPPEPQQEYTTGYNGLLTPEESTARLEAMADESDRLASEAEKQDIRVNAKQDAIEWRLDAYAIREALRAAAARSPQPTEHQAFVAVMNALDIHMPPDGQNLLDELRKIAQTVGYPWRGLVAARSPTPAAQAWQPISTAPEATAVLVFLPNYGTITANRTDKIWWWNYGHGQVVYPTHWMPIPAPPVGSPAPAKETP